MIYQVRRGFIHVLVSICVEKNFNNKKPVVLNLQILDVENNLQQRNVDDFR